jgi:hypothetical protein
LLRYPQLFKTNYFIPSILESAHFFLFYAINFNNQTATTNSALRGGLSSTIVKAIYSSPSRYIAAIRRQESIHTARAKAAAAAPAAKNEERSLEATAAPFVNEERHFVNTSLCQWGCWQKWWLPFFLLNVFSNSLFSFSLSRWERANHDHNKCGSNTGLISSVKWFSSRYIAEFHPFTEKINNEWSGFFGTRPGLKQLVRREWESERASGGVGRRVRESNAHLPDIHILLINQLIDLRRPRPIAVRRRSCRCSGSPLRTGKRTTWQSF